MPSVFVKHNIQIPLIGTWKWKKTDYDVSLIFRLNGVTGRLKLNFDTYTKTERHTFFDADFSLEFINPHSNFLRGLRTSGKLAYEAAETIYRHYLTVLEQFEGVLRTAGGVRNLMPENPISFSEFFRDNLYSLGGCSWNFEGKSPQVFNPKIFRKSRSLNPLFCRAQILTPAKWNKLQVAIDNQDFPTLEMMELLRIRANLQWRDKKIPTIEAAILVETILREYAEKTLVNCGFSRKRIKELRSDLTFNTFLNVVLPLSLTKRQASLLEEHIRKVDLLRKVRNDIVHGNIKKDEIEEQSVRDGIEGALAVVSFIRKKLSSSEPL